MRKHEKSLRALIHTLRAMRNSGSLKQNELEEVVPKLKAIRHGLRVKNFAKVNKAVAELARWFVCRNESEDSERQSRSNQ